MTLSKYINNLRFADIAVEAALSFSVTVFAGMWCGLAFIGYGWWCRYASTRRVYLLHILSNEMAKQSLSSTNDTQ